MILSFGAMPSATAEDSVAIKDDNMYQYIKEIADRKNFKKSTVIDGILYEQNFKTNELGDDTYSIENKFTTKSDGKKNTVTMNYTAKKTSDGFEVEIVDQPKLKIKNTKGNLSSVSGVADVPIINIGYVQGSWPAIIVAEDNGEVNSNFASGSDKYFQTCWENTNTWAMEWQADTTWDATSSKSWRNVNWSITGKGIDPFPPYFEWCVFPFYTERTDVTVSGTGYEDKASYYGRQAYLYGWSANDIKNPNDTNLKFKVEFIQHSIP